MLTSKNIRRQPTMEINKDEKFFNTAGPVNRPNMYKIDPLTRWDFQEVLRLINNEKYFLLHAPRQTGKTSCLEALATYLNAEGNNYAVCTNFQGGANTGNNFEIAIKNIIETLLLDTKNTLHDKFDKDKADVFFKKNGPSNGIFNMFTYLAETLDKPLVLLIDEIDSLVGVSLMAVLTQMRAGYPKRPDNFPKSILLCGLRDIKDYRMNTGEEAFPATISPFNIIAEVLRLGNFTKDEVKDLYNQHTQATGQRFSRGVIDLVMDLTDGQPWLVNALADEVTNNIKENRDRSITITTDMIEVAKERIILARRTHLDNLVERLKEERVRRVVLPMLIGEPAITKSDDVSYCLDLGLVKRVNNGIQIANKIYKEVLPRELSQNNNERFPETIPSLWRNDDGSIDVDNLLTLFKDYWYQNMEIWGKEMSGYQEACPQLVMLAFLQRIINGGGEINREYGIGRKRMDLFIKRPYHEIVNKRKKLRFQKIVIELKTIKDNQNYDSVKQEALKQTAEYALLIGVAEAEILIFNRGDEQRWTPADANETEEYNGVRLQIWKL